MNRTLKLGSVVAISLLAAACAVDTSDAPVESIDRTASELTLVATSSDTVPMTGTANPAFATVDAAIQKFMSDRCIGAAVLGVAINGNVIHNRGYGYKKGPPNPKCATAGDPFVGGTKMGATDPIRIGSNSKAILASVFRKEVKKALSAARGGASVSDQQLEDLKLINDEIDLVGPRVRAAMLSGVNNGGNINDITNEPDPCVPKAWSKVTLGQLLTHTAGLSSTDMAYDELSKIRGLSSGLKMLMQQNASGAPIAARSSLKSAQGQNAYFVPQATLEEIMIAQGDRCFAAAPGGPEKYSNAGFTLLGYVLEHVTGKSFAAPNGDPAGHADSLLAAFMNEELGFTYGIEHSHTALGARDWAEPSYRYWSASQNTYYPVVNDDKRPWCVFANGSCDFSQYEDGESRFAWDWGQHQVEHSYQNNSVAPGTGALAAEAPKMLKWMSKYTVGRPYGGDRAIYKKAHVHYGGLGGTASWVAQYDGVISYPGWGKNPDGSTSFELSKRDPGECVVPKGLDVIFTMNQNRDPKCTEANGCFNQCANTDDNCKEKKNAYSTGFYDGIVKEALCSVDWTPAPQ